MIRNRLGSYPIVTTRLPFHQESPAPCPYRVDVSSPAAGRTYAHLLASAPGNGNFSFFGAIFPDARIGRVLITAGDYAGPDDSPTRDVVMMDDFIFAEPRVR